MIQESLLKLLIAFGFGLFIGIFLGFIFYVSISGC
jgi:ABC-type nitrate/sulfonate/bicarbonate transport system permease component